MDHHMEYHTKLIPCSESTHDERPPGVDHPEVGRPQPQLLIELAVGPLGHVPFIRLFHAPAHEMPAPGEAPHLCQRRNPQPTS
jgi:hypothetical protein